MLCVCLIGDNVAKILRTYLVAIVASRVISGTEGLYSFFPLLLYIHLWRIMQWLCCVVGVCSSGLENCISFLCEAFKQKEIVKIYFNTFLTCYLLQ